MNIKVTEVSMNCACLVGHNDIFCTKLLLRILATCLREGVVAWDVDSQGVAMYLTDLCVILHFSELPRPGGSCRALNQTVCSHEHNHCPAVMDVYH